MTAARTTASASHACRVLAVETTLQGGVLVSNRILERLRATSITTATGAQIQVSASIGIASFPMHGGDAAGLIAGADGALYEAKRAGGGRVRLANPVI